MIFVINERKAGLFDLPFLFIFSQINLTYPEQSVNRVHVLLR